MPHTPDGCYLLDPSGARFLNLGFTAPEPNDPIERLSIYGERIRATFASECEAHDIHGSLSGEAHALRVEFAGQENAGSDLVMQAFLDELRAVHVLAGATLRLHPEMDDAAADQAVAAVGRAVRRLRTLLVEHNSYLTGGLRYPFAADDAPPGTAERGLAIYRFPAAAEVDVVAVEDHIRIAFAPGDLGAVTSSGFYLPTLFEGDFIIEVDYELGTWRPCAAEAACFALFAQNESSADRYYAQRMSTGDQPHRLLGSMADTLTDTHDVAGARGRFRVRRLGDEIECAHASGEEWLTLGRAPAPADREMILGAKIWSKIHCDGLEARLYNLRIVGRLATRQVPPVPIKPDPRSNPMTRS